MTMTTRKFTPAGGVVRPVFPSASPFSDELTVFAVRGSDGKLRQVEPEKLQVRFGDRIDLQQEYLDASRSRDAMSVSETISRVKSWANENPNDQTRFDTLVAVCFNLGKATSNMSLMAEAGVVRVSPQEIGN